MNKLTLKQQDEAVVTKFWVGKLNYPPQRYLELKYARELIREHGLERTLKLIEASDAVQGHQYAPAINSVKDLYHKQLKLADYYRRNKDRAPGTVRIS